MARLPRLAVAIPVALALAIPAPGSPADPPAEPMRTEDVVRLLVTGVPVSEVLAEIRSRDVEFDLSDEMVDELGIAGVPREVIEAMRERQAELHPQPVEDAVEPEPEFGEDLPVVVVTLEAPRGKDGDVGDDGDPDGEPRALYFPASLPPQIVRALELGDGGEAAEVESIAVFLACRTAYHVPDYWRSKSPLGRDFVSMPRHRMLAFHRGGERIERKDLPLGAKWTLAAAGVPEFLRLELPPTLEVPVRLDEAHDLTIGFAVEVAGRFVRLLSDERDDVSLEPGAALEVVVGNDDAKDQLGVVVAFAE